MILALGRLYTPPIRPEIANSWKIEDIIAPMDKIGRKIQNSTATKGGQGSSTLDHGGHGGSIVYLPISPNISASCLRVQFLPSTGVTLLCGPVSQCLSRGDTWRTACAVKNIISYSWCYKLQIAIKYIYSRKTHCEMRVAANIVLL